MAVQFDDCGNAFETREAAVDCGWAEHYGGADVSQQPFELDFSEIFETSFKNQPWSLSPVDYSSPQPLSDSTVAKQADKAQRYGGKGWASDLQQPYHQTLAQPAQFVQDNDVISLPPTSHFAAKPVAPALRSPDLAKTEHPSTTDTVPQMKVATGQKANTYSCDECPRTFSRMCDRTMHLKAHTKPYLCTLLSCGKGFSSRKDRNRHEFTHNPLVRYICPDSACGFEANREDGWIRHLRGQHLEDCRKAVGGTPGQ